MPFVCPCSYLVLIPVYLYGPLYRLLHRVRIERHKSDLHLSWVSLFLVSLFFLFLVSFVTVLQQEAAAYYNVNGGAKLATATMEGGEERGGEEGGRETVVWIVTAKATDDGAGQGSWGSAAVRVASMEMEGRRRPVRVPPGNARGGRGGSGGCGPIVL